MSSTAQPNTVETVKALFPADIAQMLEYRVSPTGESVLVLPRQYLGSENFAKIASIVRNAGGEYVSAGKESHFRVPVKPVEKKPTVYRKDKTIVVKVGKITMMTSTYWEKGKAILHSVKRMALTPEKKVVLDDKGKPVWNQLTVRLTLEEAEQFCNELYRLITEIKQQGTAPQRS